MRTFESGATRDDVDGKLQIEGYINPLALQVYCEYMQKHQTQADGKRREADNWQKGMGKDSHIDSGMRHVMDWWLEHRGYKSRDGLRDALCGVLFNVFGYLLEDLKEEMEGDHQAALQELHGKAVTTALPAKEVQKALLLPWTDEDLDQLELLAKFLERAGRPSQT